MTLRWQDNSTNESYFLVQRFAQGSSTATASWSVPARGGSGTTRAFSDTTASADSSYSYAVRAVAAPNGYLASSSAAVSTGAVDTPSSDQPVDLSAFLPAIGNQGGANSCSAWAADYYLRGWYAKRDGYYPSGGGATGFEPMYTYAQYQHGNPTHNGGTTIYGNLTIQLQSGANGMPGLDTRADYSQGDFDAADLPTTTEAADAAQYRISVIRDYAGPNLGATIRSSIANGQPMAVNISIFPSFGGVGPGNPLITVPTDGSSISTSHSVFAFKDDANGVWIANQWGTGWGLNGTAELSWAYVNAYVNEADGIVPVTPAGM